VPSWQSEYIGERQMMKLPEQFKGILRVSKPLDEDTGRLLADWARGNGPANVAEAAAATADGDDFDDDFTAQMTRYDDELTAAAKKGTAELRAVWDNLPKGVRDTLKSALDTRHKPDAVKADQAATS
jgi:hypothetical protein